MGRPRQYVDLRAGIVDVVLAADRVTGFFEQRGEDVANDRAAGMPDMQRTGRVGRDVFDIDLTAAAHRRIAIGGGDPEDLGEPRMPERVAESQIDEAGPRDL